MSEVVRFNKSTSEGRYVTYKHENEGTNAVLILDKEVVGEPSKLLVVIIPD